MVCHRDLKPENFLISKKCEIKESSERESERPELLRPIRSSLFLVLLFQRTAKSSSSTLELRSASTCTRSRPRLGSEVDVMGHLLRFLHTCIRTLAVQVCTVHYVAPEVLKKSPDSQHRNEVCRCLQMCPCNFCKAWIHIQKKWMCGPQGLGSSVWMFLQDCTLVLATGFRRQHDPSPGGSVRHAGRNTTVPQ